MLNSIKQQVFAVMPKIVVAKLVVPKLNIFNQAALKQFGRRIISCILLIMVILCMLLALLALARPVPAKQYQNIVLLSQQAEWPRSQQLALQLIAQAQQRQLMSANPEVTATANHTSVNQAQHIKTFAYLKLMQTYQAEQALQHDYPALEVSHEKARVGSQQAVE